MDKINKLIKAMNTRLEESRKSFEETKQHYFSCQSPGCRCFKEYCEQELLLINVEREQRWLLKTINDLT